MTRLTTLFTVHRSSYATACGGESCDSLFSNAPPLHFFFQLPILVIRVAQQNCHRQQDTPSECVPHRRRCYTSALLRQCGIGVDVYRWRGHRRAEGDVRRCRGDIAAGLDNWTDEQKWWSIHSGQHGTTTLSMREYREMDTLKFYKKRRKIGLDEHPKLKGSLWNSGKSDGKVSKTIENVAGRVAHHTRAEREKIMMSTPENVRLRKEVAAKCTAKIKRRVLKKQASNARAERHVRCCLEPGKKKTKRKPLTKISRKRVFYRRQGGMARRTSKTLRRGVHWPGRKKRSTGKQKLNTTLCRSSRQSDSWWRNLSTEGAWWCAGCT